MTAPLRKVVDAALESTVVLSFTRVGPAVRRRVDRWQDLDQIDARGRRVLVTGVTSGLGRSAAQTLAAQGAEVILLGRDEERTEGARRQIEAATGNGDLHVSIADLADLAQVRSAGEAIAADGRPLHALVHNAGALSHERHLTADGIERTVAVAVVAPMALTAALQPALTAARPGRVIWMSSGGMYTE
ncbi:MAG: SDR family NAD(P)-dependent oxidoreductase, partial [Actinomycetota bacterium]